MNCAYCNNSYPDVRIYHDPDMPEEGTALCRKCRKEPRLVIVSDDLLGSHGAALVREAGMWVCPKCSDMHFLDEDCPKDKPLPKLLTE